MKDQDKNQKAPETKLTDAQLSEVNAGTGKYHYVAKQENGAPIGLAAGEKVAMNLEIYQERFKSNARI